MEHDLQGRGEEPSQTNPDELNLAQIGDLNGIYLNFSNSTLISDF